MAEGGQSGKEYIVGGGSFSTHAFAFQTDPSLPLPFSASLSAPVIPPYTCLFVFWIPDPYTPPPVPG